MMTPPDPERLLSQAMRAQVGGPKTASGPVSAPQSGSGSDSASAPGGSRWERLTTAQLLLIAAIIGLAVGMAAALAVALTR